MDTPAVITFGKEFIHLRPAGLMDTTIQECHSAHIAMPVIWFHKPF